MAGPTGSFRAYSSVTKAISPSLSPRLAATRALILVMRDGRNLPDALEGLLNRVQTERDRALTQAMAYGVLRWYWRLDWLLSQLMQTPLKTRDIDIQACLLLGLYQLLEMRIPDHAAVAETVKLASQLKKVWAKKLINGVLRNLVRQRETLLASMQLHAVARTAHPQWLLTRLQQDWPQCWEAITTANNTSPPMSLRVNATLYDRTDYLARLAENGISAAAAPHTESGLILAEPMNVERLPEFAQGAVSVQDAAAQLAAQLLNTQPGERVLDACAAPGGKTAHILERQPRLAELIALDVSPQRLQRVDENLKRLGLQATTRAGDASQPSCWWDQQAFDRILLDAPCSASGVIRRHPDIKLLRRADDLSQTVKVQAQILNALWPLLKPGGMLLYATCSVLQQENSQQIQHFLATHADARLAPIDAAWGHEQQAGRQILPGEEGMDGFFYACIHKA